MGRRLLVSIVVLLPLTGCTMKGGPIANASTGLEGDWALYVPIPGANSATMNFSGGKFKEVIEMGSGTNAAQLAVTGSYTSGNNSLHLDNEQFQINNSVSFEAMSFRELYKKTFGTDFSLEWSGSNLLYLTSGSQGAGGGVSTVMALARNGAQPDPKKVGVNIQVHTDTTGSTDAGQTGSTSGSNTTTTTTTGSTGPTPQPPATDQSQSNQYSGQGGSVQPQQSPDTQNGQTGQNQTPQTPAPPANQTQPSPSPSGQGTSGQDQSSAQPPTQGATTSG